ncbi:MAG: ATP-grasp domain-containing protein [Chthonomonadales bacterium]
MPRNTPCRVMLVAADWDLALKVARCIFCRHEAYAAIAGPPGPLEWSRAIRSVFPLPADALEGDAAELYGLLARWCNGAGPGTIVPVDLPAQLSVSRMKHRLTQALVIPLSPAKLIHWMANKAALSRFAQSLGVDTPPFVVLEDPDTTQCRRLSFPVIVKPACGEGGGVRYPRAETPEELEEALIVARPQPHAPVIVQEYVAGDDVGVSVLALKGHIVAWTVQRHLPRNILSFDAYPPALEAVRKLVAACGYTGVAHFDFIDPPGRMAPLLLECNPRFWATILAAHAAGVCFPSLAVELALGGIAASPIPEATGMARSTPLCVKLMDPLPELAARWLRLRRRILNLPARRFGRKLRR